MEIADLLFLQEKHPQLNKFLAWFGANKNNHIWLKGLAGSYGAVFFSSVFHDLNRSVAYVLDNQEDAAYFYNDLVQITGGLDVYFFPSSYKRGIKYGEKDPGNEVMRTETLNALDVSGSPVMVVTYPEALFEQVVSTEALHTKTLSVSVGQRVTMSAVKMELVKFGFEQVDFVFQPGQFSVRGSILDVFSFSSDFPFRIDFFGDEVDSIRTFEVDNQLSKEKKEKVSVVSDVNSGSNDIVPFLQFISKDTLLAFSDYNYASGCMKNLDEENAGFEKAFNYDGFLEQVATFKIAEFGLHNAFTGSAVLEFHISPQPLFNKNFDLIFFYFIFCFLIFFI